MTPTAFAQLARLIMDEAHGLGFDTPTFRGRAAAQRSIRFHHGGATVTVDHTQPDATVAADIVAGIVEFTRRTRGPSWDKLVARSAAKLTAAAERLAADETYKPELPNPRRNP